MAKPAKKKTTKKASISKKKTAKRKAPGVKVSSKAKLLDAIVDRTLEGKVSYPFLFAGSKKEWFEALKAEGMIKTKKTGYEATKKGIDA